MVSLKSTTRNTTHTAITPKNTTHQYLAVTDRLKLLLFLTRIPSPFLRLLRTERGDSFLTPSYTRAETMS